jgi:DNA ligase (NAD+)
VGQHVAGVIANHWRDFGALREVEFEQLEDVNEIGPIVAGSLMNWLSDEVEQEQIDRMLDAGLAPVMSAPATTGEGILAGRSFLFTGKLEQMSRREANEMVKGAGGRLVSGVSKDLDVLVVGEKPGSKLKKAEALGIEVMEESAFLRLLRPFDAT